jgi:FMN phosphatase YigB (HAD superfamily)
MCHPTTHGRSERFEIPFAQLDGDGRRITRQILPNQFSKANAFLNRVNSNDPYLCRAHQFLRLISRQSSFIEQGNTGFVMNRHNLEIGNCNSQSNETCAYSFDVFDTFLLRACTTPEGVFERSFQLSPVCRSFPDAATAYVQHRRQAEARARKAAKERNGSVEVGIADIYSYFPFRLFRLDREALPLLVQAEFGAELDLCRSNSEMFRQYSEMRATGARTGFISDTYWSSAQLARLLRSCQPGLAWDFLYASCENGTNKGEGLFATYLSEQGIAPSRALHIGDNENADIKGARRHGIRAKHYPQASAALTSIFHREASVGQTLGSNQATCLDHGFRTLRRVVASRTPEKPALFALGATVLGPVIHAFNEFIANRVEQLELQGCKTAVAFLGRDGFLSHQVWEATQHRPASYIALNRRVSLIGSATTLDPLIELLSRVYKIDARTFADIVKVLPRPVIDFFARHPDGIATGEELADALPGLIGNDEIGVLAAEMRTELLRYLRREIPNFDDCNDIVLIDLGYSGSIQKALRRILDIEGIGMGLHGLYLLTMDDAFDDLADGDTAEGFISDLVVNPHAKRMLMRNVALLEQMCCAPTGSVRGYRGGDVLYEDNPQSPQQLAFGREVQAGVLAYVGAARQYSPAYALAPFANLNVAAQSVAAILGRLLLLPTDNELLLLGSLKHDVNLGTHALAPLLDGAFASRLQVAQSLPVACTAAAPPMWLAGSFAALSPLNNFLYMLFGSNQLPPDIFSDLKCGELEVGFFGADGSSNLAQANCYRTGLGDIRVRIPIARSMGIQLIVVPIAKLAREGLIAGPFLQCGLDVKEILKSTDVVMVPDQHLRHSGLERYGRYYRATQDDGALIIDASTQKSPVVIVSIGLTPLNGERVMAL